MSLCVTGNAMWQMVITVIPSQRHYYWLLMFSAHCTFSRERGFCTKTQLTMHDKLIVLCAAVVVTYFGIAQCQVKPAGKHLCLDKRSFQADIGGVKY